MRRLGLWEAAIWLRLGRVDEVGELDCVLNEEDRDVVADEIPVSLLGVELDCEAADVAGEVGGSLAAGDGREPYEGGRPPPGLLEKMRSGDIGKGLVVLEEPVDTEAPGMNHPLGDTFVVEVEDLLSELEVLEEARTPRSGLEGVLTVGDDDALLRGERGTVTTRALVGLSAAPPLRRAVAPDADPASAVAPSCVGFHGCPPAISNAFVNPPSHTQCPRTTHSVDTCRQ